MHLNRMMICFKMGFKQFLIKYQITITLSLVFIAIMDNYIEEQKQEVKVTETNITDEWTYWGNETISSAFGNSTDTLTIQSGSQPFIIKMDRNNCSVIACECYKTDYSCALLCYECSGVVTVEDLF